MLSFLRYCCSIYFFLNFWLHNTTNADSTIFAWVPVLESTCCWHTQTGEVLSVLFSSFLSFTNCSPCAEIYKTLRTMSILSVGKGSLWEEWGFAWKIWYAPWIRISPTYKFAFLKIDKFWSYTQRNSIFEEIVMMILHALLTFSELGLHNQNVFLDEILVW